MAERSVLERECAVFTRYLGAGAGDPYVLARYLAAHAAGVVELPRTARFERVIVGLARLGPGLTRALDAYSRLFGNGNLLRRKLVLLLAVLETRAPHDGTLDAPTPGSTLGMFTRMAWLALVFATLALVSALALLPVRLACALGGER